MAVSVNSTLGGMMYILDIEPERPAREDHVNSVNVTIRRNLLHESVDVSGIVSTRAGLRDRDFNGTHHLARRQGKDIGVVGRNLSGISLYFRVEGCARADGVRVFRRGEEEGELLRMIG